jgi:hypothetical protein
MLVSDHLSTILMPKFYRFSENIHSLECGRLLNPWKSLFRQDVLPCAFTLTACTQFPFMFLLSLFCRPFGGQKPPSVIDHGI